jgi:hypothetical protein
MRLAEIKGGFKVPNHQFDLMYLTDVVDEEIFQDLLEVQGKTLTFNGIEVGKDFEDLVVDHFDAKLKAYINKARVNSLPINDAGSYFTRLLRAMYDVKSQCLYLEEKYNIKTDTLIICERITPAQTLKQFDMKILAPDIFNSTLKNRRASLIDMRPVLGLPPL